MKRSQRIPVRKKICQSLISKKAKIEKIKLNSETNFERTFVTGIAFMVVQTNKAKIPLKLEKNQN